MKEKINFEKRKRNQIYLTMDYLFSGISFFDFFSKDVFEIIQNAKILTHLTLKSQVSTEILLLAFFCQNSKISQILKEYGITEEILGTLISKSTNFSENQKLSKFDNFLKNLSLKKENISLENLNKITFSMEVNKIFEKTAENSITRFKTPIITSEILFISLMEDDNSKACKLIKKCLDENIEWYILRYKLLKELHNHESILKSEVIKNHHYFAYLLKSRLSEFEFDQLIKKELLSSAVLLFRNFLISDVLKIDILSILLNDINKSIKVNNKRSYSS
jgi:hypothetical protein